MIALQHIQKMFENKLVLEDVNFTANSGEVIALIGENGAGKTTLLQIILGEVKPDRGNILLSKESVGYVPQEPVLGNTIQESFAEQTPDWQIDYALGVVGLDHKSKDTPVSSLSGGQKTRLAFARVVSADPKPSILLLDEPTNNLDAEGLYWLEKFVENFQGSIVLVSHDRKFINKTCTKIADLRKGILREYGGNYDFYRQQKAIEQKTAQQKYEQNNEERRRIEGLLVSQKERTKHIHEHMKFLNPSKQRNGFFKVSNSKVADNFFKNRVTRKIGKNIRSLEAKLGQMEEVERPEIAKNYAIELSGNVSNSKLILRLKNVSFAYDKPLLEELSFEIRGSERLHIKGVNGSGKTTLLKIVAAAIKSYTGECIVGAGVRIGYFSQDVDGLDYEISGLENLERTGADLTAIYREAKSLGLNQDDLSRVPKKLSRGQQVKLAFAKLLLDQNHLLVLDEPTNHLDIPTREKIEAALKNYNCAMIVTSHDDYFVENIGITQRMLIEKGVVRHL